MKSTFKINYIHVGTELNFSYEFLDFKETVKDEEYKEFDILDKYFNESKEAIKICFEVNCCDIKRKFYFDLFYGENIAYLFIIALGKTFQLLFKDISSITIIPETVKKSISNYDTNNTKDRKRVLMINYPYDNISINGTNLNLIEILPPRKNNNYSFNYSFYDILNGLILTKVYNEEKEIKIIKYMKKNKRVISLLMTQIDRLNQIETYEEYNKEYLQLKKYKFKKLHLNFPNGKLEEFLGDNVIKFQYDKVFSYIILYFKRKTEINFNEYKGLYTFITNHLSKIRNDINLQGYQKILIMEQFLLSATKFKSIREFINSNFQYYLLAKSEDNSILYFVKKFISDFIEELKDTDKVYYKLVELDAGISYLKRKSFYSFDLKNLNEIKIHLRDLMNDLITFYYNEEDNNNAFCSKHLKCATINIKSINNIQKLQLNKKLADNNIIEGKRIASKIIINYFHEIDGHIKLGFSNFENIESPNKCINEKNIIQTLVPNDFDSKYKNVLRIILNKNEKSDSGSFFEIIFGKSGGVYLKDLIDNIHNYWRLADMPNLFLEKLPLLSKYIKYRFIFEHYKLEDLLEPNSSMEEEIEYMEMKFIKNKIDIEEIDKRDKIIEEEVNEQENYIQENILNDKDEEEDENESKEEEESGEIDDQEEEELDIDDEYNDKYKDKKINKFDIKEKYTNLKAIKQYEDFLRKYLKDYDKYGSEYEKLCQKYGKK